MNRAPRPSAKPGQPLEPRRRPRFAWLPPSWRYLLQRIKVHQEYGRGVLAGVISLPRATAAPSATILFYPQKPSLGATAYKMCALLGYRITSDPTDRADAIILSDDATTTSARVPNGVATAHRIINDQCRDISKRHVGQVFRRTFGYDLEVEPTTHQGDMVEKLDANASKSGRIVQGPLRADEVRPECVYQRLVDNTDGEGWIAEFRVPIYDGVVPLVFLKGRTVEQRFAMRSPRGGFASPDQCFTKDELEALARFVAELKMDYGELDVLRDAADGRIYVVDANNTPHGPPLALTPDERREAMKTLSTAFQQLLDLTDTVTVPDQDTRGREPAESSRPGRARSR